MLTQRKLSDVLGSAIEGIDLSRGLADAEFSEVARALWEGGVLAIKGQRLAPGQFLAFARRFGRPEPHVIDQFHYPGYPDILILSNRRKQNGEPMGLADAGSYFHTDYSYLQVPARLTMLYSIEVPSRGGNTLFASMYAAYDGLPQRLKERLEGRIGAFTYGGRRKATALLNEEDRNWTPVFHPIVRTHPETGRKALYFDPGKILRIEGLEPAESDALIDELTERMIQPDGEYHHQWRKGDIVIWDNRCSYHKAAGDYPPEEDRIHWRVSIKERPTAGARAAD